jgi:hypothetical protein
MGALRRVEAVDAGPKALGILIPPGHKTLLIVRPRSLIWDMILMQPQQRISLQTPFWELAAREAAEAASGLFHALEAWGAGTGPGRLEAVSSANGQSHQVQAEIGSFALIACLRRPGEAYWPVSYATRAEATEVADALRAILHPAADAVQEVYFNTRHFTPTRH